MRFRESERRSAIVALIAAVNIILLIGVFSIAQARGLSGLLVDRILIHDSIVNGVLGLMALTMRGWSEAIVFVSFAGLLFWMSAGGP
jgi:hypothetical protein